MTAQDGEAAAFGAYRASRSREALVRLLELHQHRVFNVCWQVLRQRQDAEDAAQETLIEAARAAGTLPDATAFRRWLHRASICTALDQARKRARRFGLIERAAMEMPPASPVDAETRLHLFEAMSRLGDEERSLIVEHHFEGATMAQLAAREGCSHGAIWKRLVRARRSLRRALVGAGVLLGAERVAEALGSATPVRAPSALVGPKVLAAVGGIAMGTWKATASWYVAGVVVLLLLSGVGVSALRRSSEPREPEAEPAVAAVANGDGRSADAAAKASDANAGDASFAADRAELVARLKSYAGWYDQWRRLKRLEGETRMAWLSRTSLEYTNGYPILAGLRDLILAHPDAFLEFVRDPAHEHCLRGLINYALESTLMIDGEHEYRRVPVTELPPALVAGFLDVLRSGSDEQRLSVIDFLASVDGLPGEFQRQYVALLAHEEPSIQAGAVHLLGQRGMVTGETFPILEEVYRNNPSWSIRGEAAYGLASADVPEAEPWLLTRLLANRDPKVVWAFARAAELRLKSDRGPLTLDYARALAAAFETRPKDDDFEEAAKATCRLPRELAISVLRVAMACAPDEAWKSGVGATLARLTQGDFPPEQRMEELKAHVRPKVFAIQD